MAFLTGLCFLSRNSLLPILITILLSPWRFRQRQSGGHNFLLKAPTAMRQMPLWLLMRSILAPRAQKLIWKQQPLIYKVRCLNFKIWMNSKFRHNKKSKIISMHHFPKIPSLSSKARSKWNSTKIGEGKYLRLDSRAPLQTMPTSAYAKAGVPAAKTNRYASCSKRKNPWTSTTSSSGHFNCIKSRS